MLASSFGEAAIRRSLSGHERSVLHVERGAVSLHGHTVERERKPVAHGAAAVDDRYIVSLGGYLAGNGKAYLTSADNHNFS